MKSIVNIIFLLVVNLQGAVLNYTLQPSNLLSPHYMNIKILDTKELYFNKRNEIEFAELSDLAYKNGRLFAVGDRGVLYEFGTAFSNDKI